MLVKQTKKSSATFSHLQYVCVCVPVVCKHFVCNINKMRRQTIYTETMIMVAEMMKTTTTATMMMMMIMI